MLYFIKEKDYPVLSGRNSLTKSIRTINIDCHLRGERMVIDCFSEALDSPYKNDNWDGFHEAVTDLYWLDCNEIVILHHNLPSLSDKDLLIYLFILDYASEFWDRFDELSKKAIEEYTHQEIPIPNDCWVYHKLSMDIYFREEDRAIVKHNIELAHKKWGYPYRF